MEGSFAYYNLGRQRQEDTQFLLAIQPNQIGELSVLSELGTLRFSWDGWPLGACPRLQHCVRLYYVGAGDLNSGLCACLTNTL